MSGPKTEKSKFDMKGYRAALVKRKQMEGVEFDVWAFEEASKKRCQRQQPIAGSSWVREDGAYHKHTHQVKFSVPEERYDWLTRTHTGEHFLADLDSLLLRYEPLHSGLPKVWLNTEQALKVLAPLVPTIC